MSWRDIVKAKKPDYLDFDKDGDKEEPMTEALESAKKGFGETEKLSYGAKVQCDICGNMFPNYRVLDTHKGQKHANVAKSPTRKHYTKDGKEWTGKTHKMPDGKLMTENPHNEKSVRLYHKDELGSKKRSAFTR